MIEDNVGSVFMLNGSLVKTLDLVQLGVESLDNQIYEVIRVMDYVPLFCNDHLMRLKKSTILTNGDSKVKQLEFLINEIWEFIRNIKKKDFNIKILVCFCKDGKAIELLYECKSYYPSIKDYEGGVETSLIENVRQNPNVKIIKMDYKKNVLREITERCVFETLLVNMNKQVTEGSRSNVFFIKSNHLYTAPGELVLMGITRQYILEICANIGMRLVEKAVTIDMMNKMDAAFLTGTSIKALPISKIDSIRLDSGKNKWMIKILDNYNNLIKIYIDKIRNSNELV